ncbi:MAG: S41 family peptidase [Bacillota bacterium]|nr:S41 family peptidase [Bacillota bacterium]
MRRFERVMCGSLIALAVVAALGILGWLHAPADCAVPLVDVPAASVSQTGSQLRDQDQARTQAQTEAQAQPAGPLDGSAKPAEGNALVALEVINLLKNMYVSEVDVAGLLKAYDEKHSIPDMLAVLGDPYTRYMDPAQYRAMTDDMRGTFDGIGIYIGIREGQLTVMAPLKGTPGERAGLRPLDRIKFIDGKSTKDMAIEYAQSLMKGKKGTEVVLGIERDEDGKTRFFEVKIIRDTIRIPHVASEMLEGGIGYVQISSFFGDDTMDALDRELDALARQEMRGLILDLRYNPGGSFPLAIQVASRFLPSGTPVVHVVGRDGRRLTYYSGRGRKITVPVVVLVNEASASASEIVAGALQDTKAATIVGVTTFGKGLVQTIYPLSDGSAVSITTSRYLTAGGHSIDKKGIVPDVAVSLPKPEDAPAGASQDALRDTQLDRAIEVLRAKIQERKAA